MVSAASRATGGHSGHLKIEPRLLNRDDAAAYCGLSTDGFDDWRRRGLLPGPIEGTRRWDRKALDLALDKASGIETAGEGLSDLEKWRRERDRKLRQTKA